MVKAIVDAGLLRKVCQDRSVNPALLRALVAVERNVTRKKDRIEEIKLLLEKAAQKEFSK